MRIGVDVDQVVADLHTAWLAPYNVLFRNNMTPQDITDWNIEKCVKPECGSRIFDFLVPELYDVAVQPIPQALDAVDLLRARGHEIVFISSCKTPEHADAKFAWLVRHGFLPKEGGLPFFLSMRDKSLAPVEVLVDDHHGNCESFKGRYAALVTAPYNRLLPWLGMRVKSLHDFALRTPADWVMGIEAGNCGVSATPCG